MVVDTPPILIVSPTPETPSIDGLSDRFDPGKLSCACGRYDRYSLLAFLNDFFHISAFGLSFRFTLSYRVKPNIGGMRHGQPCSLDEKTPP